MNLFKCIHIPCISLMCSPSEEQVVNFTVNGITSTMVFIRRKILRCVELLNKYFSSVSFESKVSLELRIEQVNVSYTFLLQCHEKKDTQKRILFHDNLNDFCENWLNVPRYRTCCESLRWNYLFLVLFLVRSTPETRHHYWTKTIWGLHCKNSRVVMWVESTHSNTLSTCVAAGTWVDAMCVARNAYLIRANSTRPSRVAHGTHF